jgi:hypothetical protein
MASRKVRAAQIEERRRKVAANLTGGLNYRDIAEVLGVSLNTIARDAKVIFERWKKETVSSRAEHVAVENHRLDRALNAIWPLVLQGNLPAIDRFIRLSERRAALLGLDGLMGGEQISEGTQSVRDAFLRAQAEANGDG